MNYLNDENNYEVLPKKTEQIISDVISILLPTSYSDGDLDPNMFTGLGSGCGEMISTTA